MNRVFFLECLRSRHVLLILYFLKLQINALDNNLVLLSYNFEYLALTFLVAA